MPEPKPRSPDTVGGQFISIALFNPTGNDYSPVITEGIPLVVPSLVTKIVSPGELLTYVTLQDPDLVLVDVRGIDEDSAKTLINDIKDAALETCPLIGIITDIGTGAEHQSGLDSMAQDWQVNYAYPFPFDFTKIVQFAKEVHQQKFPPPPEATSDNSKPLATREINGSQPTILLVEDEPLTAELIQKYTEILGINIHIDVAENAQQALQMLRSQSHLPDLLVIDQYMPGMSGIELIQAILADPSLATKVTPQDIVIQTQVPGEVETDPRVKQWKQQGLHVIDKHDIPSNLRHLERRLNENS